MYTYIKIDFDIGICDIGRCPTRHTYIQSVFTYQHNNFSDISAMNLGEIVTATRHPSFAALYTLAMRTILYQSLSLNLFLHGLHGKS